MKEITGTDAVSDLKQFLDNFVLFHLGTDAEVSFIREGDGSLHCSIRHARVRDIQFHISPGETERYSRDIPGFEEFLLDLLTTHRRGQAIDG